ncbi:MAG: hypothetical protein NT013_10240 [Planctomycetia bacterium]|nr:hypothetical protein [Planctomycetia bacterium]
MTQATLTNWDKAAILLRALTPGPDQAVLSQLDPVQAKKLKSIMATVAKRPDLEQITRDVMREFQEIRQHAGSVSASKTDSPQHSATWAARQYSDSVATAQTNDEAGIVRSESDSVTSKLSAIAAPVLARVLKNEPLRILVLVLQALPSDHAAGVLKLLPPEGRGAVISMMAAGLKVAEPIGDCIMQTVLQQCSLIGPVAGETVAEEDVQVKRLVGILQVVDREERLRLMSLLGEENEEMAAKIDDCLYDYTDLLRIGDRSLQKILTQTDQKTLAMALKTAPDAIREKVMKNMSERVRAALAEEMEFLSEVPNAKAEAARKDITAIIRTQDKEGTLVWIEG